MAEQQTRDSFVEGIEVREGKAGEPETLGGYAAVFNQETIIDGPDGTRWRERIAPSAFTDAIGRDDVIAAVNHDHKLLLGRSRSGTLTLSADAHGLRYSVRLGKTTVARDAVESVRRGDLAGSSFKFALSKDSVRVVERATTAGDMPLLEITKVKLIDVGPVTFPAYEGTSVGLRSADVPEEVATIYRERKAAEKQAAAEKEAAAIASRDALRAELDKAKAWAK